MLEGARWRREPAARRRRRRGRLGPRPGGLFLQEEDKGDEEVCGDELQAQQPVGGAVTGDKVCQDDRHCGQVAGGRHTWHYGCEAAQHTQHAVQGAKAQRGMWRLGSTKRLGDCEKRGLAAELGSAPRQTARLQAPPTEQPPSHILLITIPALPLARPRRPWYPAPCAHPAVAGRRRGRSPG